MKMWNPFKVCPLSSSWVWCMSFGWLLNRRRAPVWNIRLHRSDFPADRVVSRLRSITFIGQDDLVVVRTVLIIGSQCARFAAISKICHIPIFWTIPTVVNLATYRVMSSVDKCRPCCSRNEYGGGLHTCCRSRLYIPLVDFSSGSRQLVPEAFVSSVGKIRFRP